MYTYKTIIFDLDGTLFKTDTVFIKAINEVRKAHGLSLINNEEAIGLIGETSASICREICGENLSDKEIELIMSEYRDIEKKLIDDSSMLYDGVKHMLQSLAKAGYNLCICTNGSRQYVDSILKKFEIGEHFTIIKSQVNGLKKFQLIKQILDESACCSAIVVGDTHFDIEAANETGCLSIGVSYGYGGDDYKDADFIVDSPIEICEIVKKINGIYKNIAEQIFNKKQYNKPLIVGINGVDTSGKTTFAKELDRYLSKAGFKTQRILMDDFHNPSHIRNKEADPVISYTNNAFNLTKIEDALMKPIISEGIVNKELTLLNVDDDKFTNKKRYIVDKETILIFEGVLLYREPLDKYFDFRIFIDISFNEVLNRAKKRDSALFGDKVVERYEKKYIPIQKLYIENHDPKNKSDIIINNEDYLNPKIIKGYSNKKSTDRIKLEKVEKKHLSEIWSMLEDEEAAEMVGVISFPEEKDYEDKNSICYAILGEQKEFLGIVELFDISWKNRRAELSITIKASNRGQGYGYKAIKRMLQVGFEEHGLMRIWLRAIETNKKAINLYKKVGFIEEGICRCESLRKGKFINQIQMSMLASEWTNRSNMETL